MRWIGLISKPGSSPLMLIKWFRGCVKIGQRSAVPDNMHGVARVPDWGVQWKSLGLQKGSARLQA